MVATACKEPYTNFLWPSSSVSDHTCETSLPGYFSPRVQLAWLPRLYFGHTAYIIVVSGRKPVMNNALHRTW